MWNAFGRAVLIQLVGSWDILRTLHSLELFRCCKSYPEWCNGFCPYGVLPKARAMATIPCMAYAAKRPLS